MYCTACGFRLKDSDRFCAQCGASTRSGGEKPPGGYRAPRRLSRPMYDKSVAGVCAGFARYLDIDVVLVRVLWLTAAIFTGVGFIAYLVCWLVMPKDYSIAPVGAASPASPSAATKDAQPPATATGASEAGQPA